MASAAPAIRPRRFALYAALSVLFGVALALGAGEVWAQVTHPMSPVQIVRGNNLHTIDGVPVWGQTDRAPRTCAEEHPERLRVLLLGSSITYGVDVPAAETFPVALEQRLNEARPDPGFCVMNFAQPAFTAQQKLATGSVEIPRYRPALVLWEGWNEFGDFAMLGTDAYGLRYLARRDDGFPGLAYVPDAPNRFLFLHSRLYEYLALKYGTLNPHPDETKGAINKLERIAALTHSVGARLGFYICPWLDRPFRESANEEFPNPTRDFAKSHGIPYYVLAHELIDQDYLALRNDACCHFNAAGHQALVPIFERIVLDILDGKPAEH